MSGLSDRSAALQQTQRGVNVHGPDAGSHWTTAADAYLCPGEALGSLGLLGEELSMTEVEKEKKDEGLFGLQLNTTLQ